MRGEHVADLGPRGRKESCRTTSLASRACLRLVGPNGRPPAANVFRRVAVVSRAHDPRRGAPPGGRQRPSFTNYRLGTRARYRGGFGKTPAARRPSLTGVPVRSSLLT